MRLLSVVVQRFWRGASAGAHVARVAHGALEGLEAGALERVTSASGAVPDAPEPDVAGVQDGVASALDRLAAVAVVLADADRHPAVAAPRQEPAQRPDPRTRLEVAGVVHGPA